MKVNKLIAMVIMCTFLLSITACSTGKDSKNTQSDTEDVMGVVIESESEDADEVLKKEVETAVGEFEYACQTSDVDAMLDCLDPGVAQSLKSGRLLLNWMSTEQDSDEIIMDTMLISLMNIADITVDLSTMHIEVEEMSIRDTVASVDASLTMNCSAGEYKDKVSIRMAKDGNKWYITGVST